MDFQEPIRPYKAPLSVISQYEGHLAFYILIWFPITTECQ